MDRSRGFEEKGLFSQDKSAAASVTFQPFLSWVPGSELHTQGLFGVVLSLESQVDANAFRIVSLELPPVARGSRQLGWP